MICTWAYLSRAACRKAREGSRRGGFLCLRSHSVLPIPGCPRGADRGQRALAVDGRSALAHKALHLRQWHLGVCISLSGFLDGPLRLVDDIPGKDTALQSGCLNPANLW